MTITPTPLDLARSLLHEGRLVDAEAVLARELQAVTERHGAGSEQWASAQCDLGNLLINADQTGRAIQCYEHAVSVAPGTDQEFRKAHLTYRLNLGLALRMAGRLDEAEAQLRAGADDRLAFYGRPHPGYAFGLIPLAELLLRRGDAAQARQVIEEAVGNLWRNRHDHVADALALRAEIVLADGSGAAIFPDLRALPDEMVQRLTPSVTNRLEDDGDPAVYRAVLSALATTLDARLGPDHPATFSAVAALANVARTLSDHATRAQAIERVLSSYDRRGEAERALNTLLGLALAQGDAGDDEAALRSYAAAYDRAAHIGNPELTSQTLRNWGLALKDADRPAEAEPRLRDAVAYAARGADPDLLGRAHIALGLFLQHEDRLADACPVLEQGLAVLDPVHPDALIGRSHLTAVIAGETCGCGNMAGTIEDAYREFVLAHLPADLLARLDVTVADGDFQVDVHLNREPTQEELQRLNAVMQSAYAEFRRRLTRR
ncbi:MAG TPA: hypothetical protein VL738_17715 [Dactylosporangium sp.]|nr:hypothetical protein [Dactylosporangium sp.]